MKSLFENFIMYVYLVSLRYRLSSTIKAFDDK